MARNELGSWRRLPARVEVEWIDSMGEGHWDSVEKQRAQSADALLEEMRCLTVGFLFDKKPKYLRVALSLSGSNRVDDIITIPRCAVRRVTVLTPKAS
jgi:hypothetical protein